MNIIQTSCKYLTIAHLFTKQFYVHTQTFIEYLAFPKY